MSRVRKVYEGPGCVKLFLGDAGQTQDDAKRLEMKPEARRDLDLVNAGWVGG